MIRIMGVISILLLVSACAVGISPGRKAVFEYPKEGIEEEIDKAEIQIKENVYFPMMELKIYQTGTDTLCDAPEFLECNSMSRAECESIGRQFLHSCIQKTKAEMDNTKGKAASKILFRKSMECMYHSYMDRTDKEKVTACLDSSM